MFTVVVQVTSSGEFVDIDFEDAPKHIPVNVRQEIVDGEE
jgi:hypothetical protein|tara:strand:+ start:2912 stop:3031 length:120 start_codon:yes stop_codon:yes gene_type:complete